MYYRDKRVNLGATLSSTPDAVAIICGNDEYANISGKLSFFQTSIGTLVLADVSGLPTNAGKCADNFHAFHIHTGGSCTGRDDDPFADADGHYNSDECPHPTHVGDMPPLISAGGRAFLAFLTDRFTVAEVVNRTVIIHESGDDFTTQPGGNAGGRIACGVIKLIKNRD